MTTSRSDRVRNVFSRPRWYLGKGAHVAVRASIVRELLGELDHARILDLGCGDGTLSLQYLSETNELTLLDLSPEMLAVARGNTPDPLMGNVRFLQQNLLEYDGRSRFHVVLCVGVLAHVADLERTVAKISELLMPGGRCVLQYTDFDRLLGKTLYLYYRGREKLGGSRYSPRRTSHRRILALASRAEAPD